jgi:hypothetical protein
MLELVIESAEELKVTLENRKFANELAIDNWVALTDKDDDATENRLQLM